MAEMVLTDAISMNAAILTDPEVAGIVKAFMENLENEVTEKILEETIKETSDVELKVGQVIES